MLESQIDEMKGNLAALKASVKKPKKEKKEKREKKRDKQMSPPVASSSKANGKPAKQSGGGGGGGSKKKSSRKHWWTTMCFPLTKRKTSVKQFSDWMARNWRKLSLSFMKVFQRLEK